MNISDSYWNLNLHLKSFICIQHWPVPTAAKLIWENNKKKYLAPNEMAHILNYLLKLHKGGFKYSTETQAQVVRLKAHVQNEYWCISSNHLFLKLAALSLWNSQFFSGKIGLWLQGKLEICNLFQDLYFLFHSLSLKRKIWWGAKQTVTSLSPIMCNEWK